MKIIDAHIHTGFHRKDFQHTAETIGNTFTLNGLNKELSSNSIVFAISISSDRKDTTPLEYDTMLSLVQKDKHIIGVLGINPEKIDTESIPKIENAMQSQFIKGIKIYPGYYHCSPNDARYTPFYKLAEKHKLPVVIHCGDTYEKTALVKYAHPLEVDELAVRFPNVNFIIAHLGNPWMLDTAETVYKNKNVFTDLSGLCIGDNITPFTQQRVKEALDYINNYTKILYGSDWPLVNMKKYLRTIQKIIPKRYHKLVFYKNAKTLFRL